jgi:tetratricopeptide (TPR) repeat protein
MAKFDRKKHREELLEKSKQETVKDKYEDFQGTKSELLLLKAGDFILEKRKEFLIGLAIIITIIVGVVGFKEFKEYRINSATEEVEKLDKKIAKNFSLTTANKIQEFEALLNKTSIKDGKLRIYKKLSDLHVQAFELNKAAEYLEKSGELISEPKELKAYYFYIAGNYREQNKEIPKAIENYSKACNFVGNNREIQSLSAWSHYNAGRLKLANGNSEAAIKDLNKVIDIESENLDIVEVKKLSTFLLLKLNKG